MYRYELHLHTKTASGCASADPAKYIEFYKQRGYSGICVTDHFFFGNTAIDRSLPWVEFVRAFCQGYYQALQAATPDFDVFFGWEHRFCGNGGDEYIILGLTPAWLMDHPEIHVMPHHEFFPYIQKAGGFVIHAHPFRERAYIHDIRLMGSAVDAIEAYNACNEDITCRRALELARNLHLPVVGGSDIHHQTDAARLSGISLPYRAKTAQELIAAIRRGDSEIITSTGSEGWQDLPLTPPTLFPVLRLEGDALVETENYFYSK